MLELQGLSSLDPISFIMVKKDANDQRNDNMYYKIEPKVSLNPPGVVEIGKTIVSDRFPSTMDSFWFSVNPGIIINPFDFVLVENLHSSKTIGIVKELQTVPVYDDFLTKYDSEEAQQHERPSQTTTTSPENLELRRLYHSRSLAISVAKVAIMANTGVKVEGTVDTIPISMPVGDGKTVRFANAEQIIFALGIPEMENPIPAGLIQTTNGLQVPVTLDITYLAGPDTTHVNASGISGNQKTSYLLFLLQSAYQKLKDQNVALIIFNTKEAELLEIHKKQKDEKDRTEKLFSILDLQIEPFDNVMYFLPRGKNGKPNSDHIPDNYKTYSYELKDIYDRLDLLVPDTYDPQHSLSSIIDYIYESWPIKTKSGKEITTWTDLFEYAEYPESVVSHKSSLLHFRSYLQRFRRSSLFTDKKVTSTYLGNEIKRIKSGDVFVVDVGTISSLEEQSFIVGDVMKSIDEIYSSRDDLSIGNDNNNKTKKNGRPNYILIFLDEINRFIPKTQPLGRMNAVSEQIMKTLIAGRARGTVLFSAQQFKSTTDYRLQENTGLHITAKLGLSELSTDPYSMLDESTKKNIVRLNKGELVMVHPAFRHPIKISFPKGAFMKLK
jgi:DNA helicase HerA-like ATPase